MTRRDGPSTGPLRKRLLLLVARLPLCNTGELARLAAVHPASARRTLGALEEEGLLVAEWHTLPAPARRFRLTDRGVRSAVHLGVAPREAVELQHEHAHGVLRHARNRLERISAARNVFISLLEQSRDPAFRARVRLRKWFVPPASEFACLDGIGVLDLPDGQRWLGIYLDRPYLAPHHLLPALRAGAHALADKPRPVILLVGMDTARAQFLRVRLREAGELTSFPPLPLVRLCSVTAVPSLLTALVRGLPASEASAGGREDPGGSGRAGGRVRGHGALETSTLATGLGTPLVAVRRMLRRLRAADLVAVLPTRPARYVLTTSGVAVLAVRDGFTPKAYARARGIACAEADGKGQRALLKNLAHDAGADAFFRLLGLRARQATASGSSEALVTWEGPGACQRVFTWQGLRSSIRPDGFGVYRVGDDGYPFHLEWDRGTMKAGQHARKLAGYRAYVEAEAYRSDRGRAPMLLYVFSRWQKEAAVLRLARELLDGLPELRVVTTTRWRLERDGPAAAIWASPSAQGRRPWLLNDSRQADSRGTKE